MLLCCIADETITIPGCRRIMISVPASVNSSSLIVLSASIVMSSSTRSSQVIFCSSVSIFLLFIPFKNEAGVVTAKAHDVGHGDVDSAVLCFIRHVVKITVRVRMVQVDGGRDNARLNHHDRDDRLYCSRGP